MSPEEAELEFGEESGTLLPAGDDDLDAGADESETPVSIVDEDNDFSIGIGLKKPVVVNKPDISKLQPVLVGGKFTPETGERLVMEVNTGKIWLHTRQYRVLSVDHTTGNVCLMNDDLGQHAGYNYKTGPSLGFDIRYAPRAGRSIGSKRRGRPPKDPTTVKPAKPVQYDAEGNEVKRKRGRPRKNPQPEGAKA